MQDTQFDSWVRKVRWRKDRLPSPVFLAFPCGSVGKDSACIAGDLGLIPGLRRSPGKGKGYPLQSSGLNCMYCIAHGVAKSWTQLSSFHFHFHIVSPSLSKIRYPQVVGVFLAFNLVPLVYISVFLPVSYCLDKCSFAV